MTSKPPGWYDDGHDALRWWDGAAWTEHVAHPDPDASADDELPLELQDLVGEGSDDEPSGAFVSATERERSKLWIVWVVLGVVLLGIVIAAAVLIPLLFLNLATSSSGVAPQDDDERAAVSAVHQYSESWLETECDAYFEATSEQFRAFERIGDCTSFESSSQSFSDTVEGFRLTVTDIERDGDAVLVDTVEHYDSYIGANGEAVVEPEPFVDRWTYVVVPEGGAWVIDEVRQ